MSCELDIGATGVVVPSLGLNAYLIYIHKTEWYFIVIRRASGT